MAGMLRQMVLRRLREQSDTGYGLCSVIEDTCGHRPSYGSMYPLLESMMKDGLLEVEKRGRKKVYSLTAKGKREAASSEEEIGQMVEEFKTHVEKFFGLMGQDPQPMLGILDRIKEDGAPLGPVTAEMLSLRDTMFRMAGTRKIKEHSKEINAILRDARRRIESI